MYKKQSVSLIYHPSPNFQEVMSLLGNTIAEYLHLERKTTRLYSRFYDAG